MRVLARLALAASLVVPAALSAQSPIIGTWNIEWELGRSIMNGESSAIQAKGTLKLEASGDSLLATVTTTSRSDGQPITRPSFTFGGRATATGAVLTQISEATLNMNGETRKQRSIGTWTLAISGAALTGEIKREIEGMMMDIPPAMVKGSRAN
ncbi:MAG: hypothetical protein K2R93_02405 [Gemmatimonadaceae bacterium]|nr:hypothetical protein [Gemmatimonadaceae bacterium]